MITEDTLASLRENDERLDNLFVFLDDYSFQGDEDDISLLQALRHNTRVTAVDCDMHLDELVVPLKNFMTGVGLLQNLQRLRCSSSGDYAVTMAGLALALQANSGPGAKSTTQLTDLDLANFLLQDPGQDESALVRVSSSYRDFVNALRNHPTLASFNLGFGFASSSSLYHSDPTRQDPTGEAHCSLTPLLEAVMTLPKLDWVRLDGAGFAPRQALTPQGLTTLFRASTLTALEVQDFDLSPNHLEAVAQAMGANSSLKMLTLSCHEFCNGDPHPTTSRLAQALRTNRHLEKLQLSWNLLYRKKSRKAAANYDALMELFQALEVNPSLKKLQIAGVCPPPPCASLQQAFRHMLQHNYSLQTIQISSIFCTEEWQREIRLHTRLNSMGRGQLVRNTNATTRSQWMEVFAQVQDDLSCLFHLLLLNPLLCSSTAAIGQAS